MVGAEAAGIASGVRFNATITGDANDTAGGKREIPDLQANLSWQLRESSENRTFRRVVENRPVDA